MTDVAKTVSGVAERYAAALFELAAEAGALDTVETDLNSFAALLGQSEDLTRLVRSPVFSADEQSRAIAAIIDAAKLDGLAANLIKVAARNRRLFAVPDMITSFRQMLAKHRGEVNATVTSAEPLTAANIAAVKEALKAATGKDVTLEQKVDPALIGGLIVQVGSRMIDTSLRTKLGALRHAMKEAG